MEDDVIVIKGKRYHVDELEKLPKSLKPANVTSRINQTTYGYFGELNPLSNFFPAPFIYEDQTYHCSEQFIQMRKAELFKDKHAIKRIRDASSGHQCKIEGAKVKNFDKAIWEQKAYQLCLPGICQKFIANAAPRQLLLTKTKGKRLVECSKDVTWGCGMAIQNEKCLDTSLWTSQGIMGELLEEIRRELSGPEEAELPPLPNFIKFGVPEAKEKSHMANKAFESSTHQNQQNANSSIPTAPIPNIRSYPKPVAALIERHDNMDTNPADDTSSASSSSDEDNSDV